jgi:hypothetical protein
MMIIPEGRMLAEPMQELVIEADLNDPYDGAIRILGDAQRFGFELQSVALTAKSDGRASAIITLYVPTSVDTQIVCARLARHPAVQRVNAQADYSRASLDCPQAVAA